MIIKSPVPEGIESVLDVGRYLGLLPFRRSEEVIDRWGKAGNLIKKLYSLYVFLANSLILTFAIMLFFRDLEAGNADLVEQFLDMVYHCHILITIVVCIYQSKNIDECLKTWRKLEALFHAFESDGGIERVIIKKPQCPSHCHPSGPEYPITVVCQDGPEMHDKFVQRANIITTVYTTCIFVGAVSYFITISIEEKASVLEHYMYEVSKIYIIKELIFWWTGYYVLFIGGE